MNQQELIARLLLVSEHFNMSPTRMAEQSGIRSSNFSKMMRDQQRISDNTLRKIATTFGVNYHWLSTGEGEMIDKEAGLVNYQFGNNDSNVQNSTELFTKALDEIAAQRRLTEHVQSLLSEAQATIRELSAQLISHIQSISK